MSRQIDKESGMFGKIYIDATPLKRVKYGMLNFVNDLRELVDPEYGVPSHIKLR